MLLASSTTSTTKSGWVAGLGSAVALQGNWSARLEWLHIDLGSVSNSFTTSGLTGGAIPSTQTTVWSRAERYDVIRLGLDYRLSR
jgi:outer membrane immunogenic protein